MSKKASGKGEENDKSESSHSEDITGPEGVELSLDPESGDLLDPVERWWNEPVEEVEVAPTEVNVSIAESGEEDRNIDGLDAIGLPPRRKDKKKRAAAEGVASGLELPPLLPEDPVLAIEEEVAEDQLQEKEEEAASLNANDTQTEDSPAGELLEVADAVDSDPIEKRERKRAEVSSPEVAEDVPASEANSSEDEVESPAVGNVILEAAEKAPAKGRKLITPPVLPKLILEEPKEEPHAESLEEEENEEAPSKSGPPPLPSMID
ncbi:MAG: hypothetical protein P1U87_15050, partial [Verrucomicrobiales bacterium]|nr:hypothetical protein [Verrucomicrobiales bacterium]